MPTSKTPLRRRVGLAGVLLGPALGALVALLLPSEFRAVSGDVLALTYAAKVTLGLLVWMATWWLLEAVDVEATALLPLVVLPLTGVSSMTAAAAPYAHHLVFLFLGGFLLALAMQRWGLDRRIALLTVRCVGTRPVSLVGGFMVATAVLSSCVSNTATTAMMLPIALSVLGLRSQGAPSDGQEDPAEEALRPCLLLGIAYAASIGGLATIIGSPPNTFFASFAEKQLGETISFSRWLRIGLPIAVILLPLTWWYLTRLAFRLPPAEIPGGRATIDAELRQLGRMKVGEWVTLCAFFAAVLGWIGRPQLASWVPGLNDGVVAVTAALVLFCVPVSLTSGERVLDWATARRLPFGTLLLFGGGLSLAEAVRVHGVADYLGSQAQILGGWPAWLVTLVVTTSVIFLTELTSNLATTAAIVPILAALAPGLGVDPLALCLPATLAASCAFMLPVATPPNAIIFGSGYVTVPEMCRVGLWLNLLSVLVLSLACNLLVLPLFRL